MIIIEDKPKSFRCKVTWFVSKYSTGCFGGLGVKEYKKYFYTKKSAIAFAKAENSQHSKSTFCVTWE